MPCVFLLPVGCSSAAPGRSKRLCWPGSPAGIIPCGGQAGNVVLRVGAPEACRATRLSHGFADGQGLGKTRGRAGTRKTSGFSSKNLPPGCSSCLGEFAHIYVESQALEAPHMMANDMPPLTLCCIREPSPRIWTFYFVKRETAPVQCGNASEGYGCHRGRQQTKASS